MTDPIAQHLAEIVALQRQILANQDAPPIADGSVPKSAPWVRGGNHIFLSGRLATTGDQLLVGTGAVAPN